MGDRVVVQTDKTELSIEIFLWRERKYDKDTDLGHLDCLSASDSDAAWPDTFMELIGAADHVQLMYYVDFYSPFNHLEKDWETILESASAAPPLSIAF